MCGTTLHGDRTSRIALSARLADEPSEDADAQGAAQRGDEASGSKSGLRWSGLSDRGVTRRAPRADSPDPTARVLESRIEFQ